MKAVSSETGDCRGLKGSGPTVTTSIAGIRILRLDGTGSGSVEGGSRGPDTVNRVESVDTLRVGRESRDVGTGSPRVWTADLDEGGGWERDTPGFPTRDGRLLFRTSYPSGGETRSLSGTTGTTGVGGVGRSREKSRLR